MFCPKCGKINPDTNENCSGCGAVLHDETAQVPEKKNNKILKAAIISIIIIAVIVLAVVFLTGCNGNEAPDLKDRITY